MCLFIDYSSCFKDNIYSFPLRGLFLNVSSVLCIISTASKFLLTRHLFYSLLFMLETLLQCLIVLGCPFIPKGEVLEWYWMLCVDSLNLWNTSLKIGLSTRCPRCAVGAFPNVSMQKYFLWGPPTSERSPLGLPLGVLNILANNKQGGVPHCLICRFSADPSVFSSGLHLLW